MADDKGANQAQEVSPPSRSQQVGQLRLLAPVNGKTESGPSSDTALGTIGIVAPNRPATAPGPSNWLREPDEPLLDPNMLDFRVVEEEPWVAPSVLPPTGAAGPSGVLPTEAQSSPHFVPYEDRWRIGFPTWNRYGQVTATGVDNTFASGLLINPYRQSVIKGDYPIYGQHLFLNLSVANSTLTEGRQLPTATTPFESTRGAGQHEFFGNPNQFFLLNDTAIPINILHGDAAFKPPDWQIKLTPIFNTNYLAVNELAIVSPDVRNGTTRLRDFFALQEYFFETKLADYGPNYDSVSIRAGNQPFTSDFRGFVFSDVNRMVRLFGSRLSNRDQFNLIWVKQVEKDTNSFLNTFRDRHEMTAIANYFHQDTVWPGYTSELSFLYNLDGPSFLFDNNGFLVRPDPVGVYSPHQVQAYYLGWGGDGHINRLNISHQVYYATGYDTLNPLAGRPQVIDAYMAACELSYDQDWIRYRFSLFDSSGDGNPKDGKARGFDSILDNPQFAGGQFSYWIRQAIPLQGVNLTNRLSLVPDLRSSKFQGQSNFVNPGLYLINLGMDFDLTPHLKSINNCNFLWFNKTQTLEQFVFQEHIHHYIGVDLSTGLEYRPLLSNNIVFVGGIAGLIPGQGFKDLYNPFMGGSIGPLAMGFLDMTVVF
ncbi:MAG TPA: hypothetical protein VHC22_32120 [Pirellulales bacterium]|nr:hypothetical protein [Pirellulales bacterium]